MTYDVIVVGGGTSGMMAAISAAQSGTKTLIIEKNKKMGRKLTLTGGGRCNVTNNRPSAHIIEHIPGNGTFLYSAFSQFDNYDIMAFFEENGVSLKEEDHGRMFPVSDSSKTIVTCLSNRLKELGVRTLYQRPVAHLIVTDGAIAGVELADGEQLAARCVILTTGGLTYGYTGSTGDGYKLAKECGHHVTRLYATESPLKSNAGFIRDKTLQGLSLQDVTLSVLDEKGKSIAAHRMDVLFTHFGLSGPAALRCSMFVNQELVRRPEVLVEIDAMPDSSEAEIVSQLKMEQTRQGNKSVKNGLKQFLPERYVLFLLEASGISQQEPFKQVTEKKLSAFAKLVKHFPVPVHQTYPLEKSFVTGGGIDLPEVTPKTMESRLIDGLFFAGELLDINGYTGGYNITAAFVTGFVAGKHAAETASYLQWT